MKKRYIANCLKQYKKSSPLRLHMPGHKGENRLGLGNSYSYDVTELSFSDNLADPTSVIKSAEEDIARLCSAKKSYLLTGGSTLGVLASIYAIKHLGKKLIVQKGSHKSVFNALQLLNIQPVFLNEKSENGLITVKTFENEDLFESADNDLIGALITSPDYFGRSADLKKISKILHKNGKVLIVDGAHGGHFAKFNKECYAGKYADVWVDGAHKTLNTLTQGAVLNLNNLDLQEGIEKGLDIFSTSSPSYLIMASIEDGVKALHESSTKKLNEFILNTEKVKKTVLSKGFSLVESDDILKIGINLNNLANGYEVGEYLEKKGIFAELVSDNYLLFMLGLNFSSEQADRLIDALNGIILKQQKTQNLKKNTKLQVKTSYLQAVNSPYEWVDVKNAKGLVCAENAGLFPPCYPLIVAGEVFDNRVIDQLLNKNTFGVKNGKVKVVKER